MYIALVPYIPKASEVSEPPVMEIRVPSLSTGVLN